MSDSPEEPDGTYSCDRCGAVVPDSRFEWIGKFAYIGSCPSCGAALGGVGDPGPDDLGEIAFESDRGIVLEDAGADPIRVASIIRRATGMSAPEALELARRKDVEILRVDHHRLAYLQELHRSLESAGARAVIR